MLLLLPKELREVGVGIETYLHLWAELLGLRLGRSISHSLPVFFFVLFFGLLDVIVDLRSDLLHATKNTIVLSVRLDSAPHHLHKGLVLELGIQGLLGLALCCEVTTAATEGTLLREDVLHGTNDLALGSGFNFVVDNLVVDLAENVIHGKALKDYS